MAKHRKRRIPQLSEKPEVTSRRYYTFFRDEGGRPRRKRFSTDRRASGITYHRWVVESYDQASTVITNEGPDGTATDTSLPVIANAYVQHEKHRVRPENSRRTKGTISFRVFHDERKHIVNILSWCRERYGDKLKASGLYVTTDPYLTHAQPAGRPSTNVDGPIIDFGGFLRPLGRRWSHSPGDSDDARQISQQPAATLLVHQRGVFDPLGPALGRTQQGIVIDVLG